MAASRAPGCTRSMRIGHLMRLYLINPFNPLVSLANTRESRWNRYRVWKPLGLLVLAALTPREWDITVIDENLCLPDYQAMPSPDLVGITAFTSQASRAYELAAQFREKNVPVVMGGIHATMCPEEAAAHVDTVATGEGETVWPEILRDAAAGRLAGSYQGHHIAMDRIPQPRHDLLAGQYAFGSIQTTRGCPLNCSFCSVTAFNGNRYRHRPIDHVIREMRSVREKWLLVVDDNLIGTSKAHIQRAKDLFTAMIAADLGKKWICQVTINMADDDELLDLARRAGCQGVFIGFESPSVQGLAEVGKKFNLLKGSNFRKSVKQIQRHGILVVGSFIMGLDSDEPGVGGRIARAARSYGLDILNALFLTPLPGTRLWDQMKSQDRIAARDFPADWRYYTLGFPTAHYRNFSWTSILKEMSQCEARFYSRWNILRRVTRSLVGRRRPLLSLVTNLSYRNNARLARRSFRQFATERGDR